MLLKKSNNVANQAITAEGFVGAYNRYLLVKEDGCPNYALRLSEIEPGGNTSYHAHEEEHEYYFLEGEGTVVDNNKVEHAVEPGDAVYIPQKQKHQVKNVGRGVLKFICTIPILKDGDGKSTKLI